MFFGRIKKEKFIAKDGMVIIYYSKDGYVYVSFSEKLAEGFEYVTEEVFSEKTKELYQERPEWETAGKAITQIANENRYGIAILSDNIEDNSKLKVPTADQLKFVHDMTCETKEMVDEVKNALQNGGQVVTGLKDGSVTTPKLADGAVTKEKISNFSINDEKLQNDCITTDKIRNISISELKLQNACVTTDKIRNNSINDEKLQNDCVTTDKIRNDSINEFKLQNNCINEFKLQDGCVVTDKIRNNSITANKIVDIKSITPHLVMGLYANDISTIEGLENTNYPVIVIGRRAEASTTPGGCMAIGWECKANGGWSIALGLEAEANGEFSIALGQEAKAEVAGTIAIGLYSISTRGNSISLGRSATSSGTHAIAVGFQSTARGELSLALGEYAEATHDFSTALGRNAKTTCNEQIMLGVGSATPYANKPLVVTSDKRDKTDIKDIEYNSLDFLNKLKPKQYKTDYRLNYKREEEISKEEYESLDDYTKKSHTTIYPIYELENGSRYINYFNRENIKKDSDRYTTIFKTKDIFLSREMAEAKLRKKLKKDDIENVESFKGKEVGEIILKEVFLESDGSMAGERYHNGFLAQEVEDVAKSMNFDFAGVKYLAHNGDGEDMYGLAYEEFIAPIVASIQELSKDNNSLKNENTVLKDKIASLETEQESLKKIINELVAKVSSLENIKQDNKIEPNEDSIKDIQEEQKKDNIEETQEGQNKDIIEEDQNNK